MTMTTLKRIIFLNYYFPPQHYTLKCFFLLKTINATKFVLFLHLFFCSRLLVPVIGYVFSFYFSIICFIYLILTGLAVLFLIFLFVAIVGILSLYQEGADSLEAVFDRLIMSLLILRKKIHFDLKNEAVSERCLTGYFFFPLEVN